LKLALRGTQRERFTHSVNTIFRNDFQFFVASFPKRHFVDIRRRFQLRNEGARGLIGTK
jgi:hypothetical protein